MKRLCLLLMIAVAGLAAPAQTNSPAVAQSVTVSSHVLNYDDVNHRWVYQDHVVVVSPEMKLTCEWLTGNLPHDGNPDRHVTASTNVVVDFIDNQGHTNHTTSDSAIYDYKLANLVTNASVVLSGHALLENDQFTVTGEPLTINLVTKQFSATNQVVTFKNQNINLFGTNSTKTNHLSAPK